MTSSAEERIKMVPNRKTVDRVWVMEDYHCSIDIVVLFYLL